MYSFLPLSVTHLRSVYLFEYVYASSFYRIYWERGTFALDFVYDSKGTLAELVQNLKIGKFAAPLSCSRTFLSHLKFNL